LGAATPAPPVTLEPPFPPLQPAWLPGRFLADRGRAGAGQKCSTHRHRNTTGPRVRGPTNHLWCKTVRKGAEAPRQLPPLQHPYPREPGAGGLAPQQPTTPRRFRYWLSSARYRRLGTQKQAPPHRGRADQQQLPPGPLLPTTRAALAASQTCSRSQLVSTPLQTYSAPQVQGYVRSHV
jgi:hypothetical protein